MQSFVANFQRFIFLLFVFAARENVQRKTMWRPGKRGEMPFFILNVINTVVIDAVFILYLTVIGFSILGGLFLDDDNNNNNNNNYKIIIAALTKWIISKKAIQTVGWLAKFSKITSTLKNQSFLSKKPASRYLDTPDYGIKLDVQGSNYIIYKLTVQTTGQTKRNNNNNISNDDNNNFNQGQPLLLWTPGGHRAAFT